MKKKPFAQRYIRIWVKERFLVKPEFVGREILLPQHLKDWSHKLYWDWGSHADIVNVNHSVSHDIAIGCGLTTMTDEEFLKTKKACMIEADPTKYKRRQSARTRKKLEQLRIAKKCGNAIMDLEL